MGKMSSKRIPGEGKSGNWRNAAFSSILSYKRSKSASVCAVGEETVGYRVQSVLGLRSLDFVLQGLRTLESSVVEAAPEAESFPWGALASSVGFSF